MFLFAVVSGLNLIIPEINKILTDDYINTKTPEQIEAAKYVTVVLSMLICQCILRVIGVLRSHALIHASNSMIVDLRNMLFGIQRILADFSRHCTNRLTFEHFKSWIRKAFNLSKSS